MIQQADGSELLDDEEEITESGGSLQDLDPLNPGTPAGKNKREEVMACALAFRNNSK